MSSKKCGTRSALGRGWPATGAFTSRRGSGAGSLGGSDRIMIPTWTCEFAIMCAVTGMWPLREYNSSRVDINPRTFLRIWFLFVMPILVLWGFGFETVGERLRTQVAGVVVSSKDVLVSGRRGTEYVVRGSDGQDQFYAAGATDASLPRSMPVGTHLKKERWHLYYERDGRRVDDFPIVFYSVVLTLALGCIIFEVVGPCGRRSQPGRAGFPLWPE